MIFNEIRALAEELRSRLDSLSASDQMVRHPGMQRALGVLTDIERAGPGAWAVLQERARQQAPMQAGGEALSRMHDAEHNRAGELGLAATTYVAAAISKPGVRRQYRERMHEGAVRHPMTGMWPVWTWPTTWDAEAFKMGKGDTEAERIRELEKAGALVAAEIDRRRAL